MTPRTKHCVTHWMTHSPSKLTHPLPSIEFIKHFSFASCWKPKTLHESRPTVTHVFSIKRFFNSRDIFFKQQRKLRARWQTTSHRSESNFSRLNHPTTTQQIWTFTHERALFPNVRLFFSREMATSRKFFWCSLWEEWKVCSILLDFLLFLVITAGLSC